MPETPNEFLKRLGDELTAVVEGYFETHAVVITPELIRAAQRHTKTVRLYDEYAYMENSTCQGCDGWGCQTCYSSAFKRTKHDA